MIETRKDLKFYLEEDKKRFGGKEPGLLHWFFHNEVWYIFHYIRHLRYVEFYINRHKKKSLFFIWHFFRYKRLSFKIHVTIYPNTIGPGIRLYHVGGFVHVGPNVRIGKNCTLLPGVVFGNRSEIEENCEVRVGDDFYAGLDAKFFGTLRIGNNVSVGANAVVTKDIPDNAIVGGVPAKVIRMKQ